MILKNVNHQDTKITKYTVLNTNIYSVFFVPFVSSC